MDVQRLLLSRAIRDGAVVTLVENGITADHFDDEEHRQVYAYMLGFWREYGEPPTLEVIKANYPAYRLPKAREPLQYYIDELREARTKGLTIHMLREAAQAVEDDEVKRALEVVGSTLTEIHLEMTVLRDEDVTQSWETRLEEFRKLSELADGLLGIPTGFRTIDQATAGLQPEQLVTLVGLPKQGKSTILLRVALNTHDWGKVPLLVGFEMSNREQWARYAAMVAHLDHHKLITGRLNPLEQKRLEKELRKRQNRQPFILSNDISSTTTVSGIAAKIEQHQPDAVFVDGIYLMDDERGEPKGSPQAITNITRDLKRLAQRRRVPVMGTTQVLPSKVSKRRGLTSDAIGYSSSFMQDSDVIMGIEATDMEDVRRLRILDARNTGPKSVLIRADWTTGEFEEMEEDDTEDEDLYVGGGDGGLRD